jgi:hypothetical protein
MSMINCSILRCQNHTLNERAMFIVSSCCRPVASIMYMNPTEMVLGRFDWPIISSNLLSFILAWISICDLLRAQRTCHLLIQKHTAQATAISTISWGSFTSLFSTSFLVQGLKLFTCHFVEWSNFLRHYKIPRRLKRNL